VSCVLTEISATGRSLVQRIPTVVCHCVIYKPHEKGGPSPRWAVVPEPEREKERILSS
jgi:hypothetical protein